MFSFFSDHNICIFLALYSLYIFLALKFCFQAFRGSHGLIRVGSDPPKTPLYLAHWILPIHYLSPLVLLWRLGIFQP